jgi:predicted alpha-1,6-mannanase (GH76 family)
MLHLRSLLTIFLLFLVLSCCAENSTAQTTHSPVIDQLQRAAKGVETLQGWYEQPTGLYTTTGWWNSANAITVLVDYARASRSTQYNPVFLNTLVAAQKGDKGFINFLNNFYDDEGWWALAWIDAYDLTNDRKFLAMAESIFADMTGGWDSVCGGGIWWSKDRIYKAAIANELFLSTAAHLANRDVANRALYLNWADRAWTWFAHSGLINAQHLINDGLGTADGKTNASACHNNGQTTWSYNQGVILGGLVELAKLNTDSSLLQTAEALASAAIGTLADRNGILHDPCEPNCGNDGVQFKGIFIRNLTAYYRSHPKLAYKEFILANANAIWGKAQGPGVQFGQVWAGPFDKSNAGSQSSALDVIIAAAELETAP